MDNFIESVSELIGNLIAIVVVGSSLLLFAGEIRLAALKKASHGSTRLSAFTFKMTKTTLPTTHGGRHGVGKKSH